VRVTCWQGQKRNKKKLGTDSGRLSCRISNAAKDAGRALFPPQPPAPICPRNHRRKSQHPNLRNLLDRNPPCSYLHSTSRRRTITTVDTKYNITLSTWYALIVFQCSYLVRNSYFIVVSRNRTSRRLGGAPLKYQEPPVLLPPRNQRLAVGATSWDRSREAQGVHGPASQLQGCRTSELCAFGRQDPRRASSRQASR
jgi:hypothetical protein